MNKSRESGSGLTEDGQIGANGLCAKSSEIGFRDVDQVMIDQAMIDQATENCGGPRTEWEASRSLPRGSSWESGGKSEDGQAAPALTGSGNSAHMETVMERQ